MTDSVKMTRQGDGLYEVLFGDGCKHSGCNLKQAMDVIEEHLYGNIEEPQIVQNHTDDTPVCSDLDSGSSVWPKKYGNS